MGGERVRVPYGGVRSDDQDLDYTEAIGRFLFKYI